MATNNSINSSNPVEVGKGGIGVATLLDHGILLGSGVSAVTATAEMSNGQMLLGDTGNDPVPATLTAGSGIRVTNAAHSVTVDNLLTLNNQTGTSYTTVLGDGFKYITMNNAAASTLTIPPNASVAYPIGTVIYVQQLGAGQVTLTQGAAVTFRSAGNKYKITGQYSCATLIKILSDTWGIRGDVAA